MFDFELRYKIKYIKTVPQKLLNQWKKESDVSNPNVGLDVELIDKNGNVIEELSGHDGMEIKEIETLKIGDTYTLSFYLEKDLIGKIKTFRIRSING